MKKPKTLYPYPAILEPSEDGYSLFFPDFPGTASGGKNYESAIKNGKDCLSLHIYTMIEDGDKIPKPSSVAKIKGTLGRDDLFALIEPDIFSIKARLQKKDKSVRIDITIPQSLLKEASYKAKKLGINRSKLIQKALQEVI